MAFIFVYFANRGSPPPPTLAVAGAGPAGGGGGGASPAAAGAGAPGSGGASPGGRGGAASIGNGGALLLDCLALSLCTRMRRRVFRPDTVGRLERMHMCDREMDQGSEM